ncbi:MAG: hypothetical protein ACHQF2_03790 [Flavobacteriales bacterium]
MGVARDDGEALNKPAYFIFRASSRAKRGDLQRGTSVSAENSIAHGLRPADYHASFHSARNDAHPSKSALPR